MGKIYQINVKEGTLSRAIFPITSVRAVYHGSNVKASDHIKGVVKPIVDKYRADIESCKRKVNGEVEETVGERINSDYLDIYNIINEGKNMDFSFNGPALHVDNGTDGYMNNIKIKGMSLVNHFKCNMSNEPYRVVLPNGICKYYADVSPRTWVNFFEIDTQNYKPGGVWYSIYINVLYNTLEFDQTEKFKNCIVVGQLSSNPGQKQSVFVDSLSIQTNMPTRLGVLHRIQRKTIDDFTVLYMDNDKNYGARMYIPNTATKGTIIFKPYIFELDEINALGLTEADIKQAILNDTLNERRIMNVGTSNNEVIIRNNNGNNLVNMYDYKDIYSFRTATGIKIADDREAIIGNLVDNIGNNIRANGKNIGLTSKFMSNVGYSYDDIDAVKIDPETNSLSILPPQGELEIEPNASSPFFLRPIKIGDNRKFNIGFKMNCPDYRIVLQCYDETFTPTNSVRGYTWTNGPKDYMTYPSLNGFYCEINESNNTFDAVIDFTPLSSVVPPAKYFTIGFFRYKPESFSSDKRVEISNIFIREYDENKRGYYPCIEEEMRVKVPTNKTSEEYGLKRVWRENNPLGCGIDNITIGDDGLAKYNQEVGYVELDGPRAGVNNITLITGPKVNNYLQPFIWSKEFELSKRLNLKYQPLLSDRYSFNDRYWYQNLPNPAIHAYTPDSTADIVGVIWGKFATNNADLATYFKQNPTIVYYILNNPIVHDIGNVHVMKTFKGKNYIYSFSDGLYPQVELSIPISRPSSVSVFTQRIKSLEGEQNVIESNIQNNLSRTLTIQDEIDKALLDIDKRLDKLENS